MKNSLLLLASLTVSGTVLPGVALGQTASWPGVPFGSSAAHATSLLSRQPPVCTDTTGDDKDCVGLTMEAGSTAGEWIVKPAYELSLPALPGPLHFNTFLYFFNTDRQLARVDLKLDTDRYKLEGKTGSDLVDFAGEPVLDELFGKYGIPLEISAACEPAETRRLLRTHADAIDCNVLWKNQGGTINLIWKYIGTSKAYSLVVRYAWVQSGL